MASWIDDFEGNKLNPKWVATRISLGAQNDGVWTREIKDSKLYYRGVSGGTEGSYWGELLSLPVNALGDIIIECSCRQKLTTAWNHSRFGPAGVNFTTAHAGQVSYGPCILTGAGTNNLFGGFIAGVPTNFPGFPSKNFITKGTDDIFLTRLIRKNGYLFIYINGTFVGQGAYAAAITNVNIYSGWFQVANPTGQERWVDWIKVWPSSVVL